MSIKHEHPESDATSRERIRAAGLRATASRIAVLDLLLERGAPMSHGEVVEALGEGTWDKTTLYRNLVDLAEAGVLHRTELGDRLWRFEVCDHDDHHGDESHHPHFVCTECGNVACLPGVAFPASESVPLAVRHGEVEIQIRGRCDDCRR